jgi:hypothetical protein
MTGWLLHTWRGTATCCTTGVLEITRARMSMADTGADAIAAAATADPTIVFTSMVFMSEPLFQRTDQVEPLWRADPACQRLQILRNQTGFEAQSSVAGL